MQQASAGVHDTPSGIYGSIHVVHCLVTEAVTLA